MKLEIINYQYGMFRKNTIRIVLYISAVFLMTNLNALVDAVLHPEIPYLDEEHLIVGGVTALLASILFAVIEIYLRRIAKGIVKQREVEEEIKRNYDIQTVLNLLLSFSLENISLEDLLKRSLNLILSIPWLSFESKGGIFLAEDDRKTLVLKVQKELPGDLQKTCARINIGMCLCGRAASKKEIEFADCIDNRHEIRYEGITQHGHYCVPILFAGKLLGIINIYVKEGHRRSQKEDAFLTSIANALAGVIVRKQAEAEQLKEKKLESIGILAGGIAHDFNNLLAVIVGCISLAKMHLSPEDNIFEILDKAEEASIRAADLTKLLITFSKGGTPVKTMVPIAELIRSSVNFDLSGSNVSCKFNMPDDIYPVEADEGQLQWVIHNMVLNARDAMPEGGVLNILAQNIVVGEKSALPFKKGKYVRISIEDHGIGIPEENLPKIFDPYFTTKKRATQKGMGLGLSISYSIIKSHNGLITVESEVGAGTTFHIYLPALQEDILTKER